MKKIYLFITMGVCLLCNCSHVEEWGEPKDSTPPGPVSGIHVENLNGGARLTYTLPSDKDLMGVKVVYSLNENDESMERYASALTDTIELEGFGDVNPHTVMLHTVDNSGNVSEGVSAVIQPLIPLISLIRQTLDVSATFGGVRLKWDNAMQKDMAASLYIADSTGEMTLFDTFFSNSESGSVTFRPFESTAQTFRIELKDRWNNYSTPLDTVITPLYEMQLPGRNGSVYIWSQYGDADETYLYRGDLHNDLRQSVVARRVFALVHNGNRVTENSENYWHPGYGYTLADYLPGTAGSLVLPFYFTIDMGRKAVYSRMNMLARNRTPNYSATIPCEFEIWGSNNPKDITEIGDGSREANLAYWTRWPQANGTDAWKNDWVKIATCKIVLSSGATKYVAGMALSAEDIAKYLSDGFDFDMDTEITEGFRYLRWVVNDTNVSPTDLQIDDIKFWGAYTE
jgi:hypothetical protein